MWTPGMHPRCFLCREALTDDDIAEGSDLCPHCFKRDNEQEHQEIETWQAA